MGKSSGGPQASRASALWTVRSSMTSTMAPSKVTATTRFLDVANQVYAYRRFGNGLGPPPLLCLQHFMGTLDNWDPAVTDPLASSREVILFDNAGVGRFTGTVPETMADMATHGLSVLDGLGTNRATCSDFRSAEWSRSKWCSIDHRC